MERLTKYDSNGKAMPKTNIAFSPLKNQECINRLAAIEDILGDEYNINRLRELVQANKDGRCVVLLAGGYTNQDGENALRSAMHTCYHTNNPVKRYIADAVAEKFIRETVEEMLKGE